MKRSKKVLVVFSLLLYGCAGQGVDQGYPEYDNLSCAELNQEYREVLAEKIDAFNDRMKGNDANLVVSTALGALSGHGRALYNEGSLSEEDAEARLKALRDQMRKKSCNNCSARRISK